jgi:hypothetical protein
MRFIISELILNGNRPESPPVKGEEEDELYILNVLVPFQTSGTSLVFSAAEYF